VSYSKLPLMAYTRPVMAPKTRTQRRVHNTDERRRFANVLHAAADCSWRQACTRLRAMLLRRGQIDMG
jgi:hypothetical protein